MNKTPTKRKKAKAKQKKPIKAEDLQLSAKQLVGRIMARSLRSLYRDVEQLTAKERLDFAIKLLPYLLPKASVDMTEEQPNKTTIGAAIQIQVISDKSEVINPESQIINNEAE